MNCLRCGRKLKNKRSIELGYGPGCYKKIKVEDKKTIPMERIVKGKKHLAKKEFIIKDSIKVEIVEDNAVGITNEYISSGVAYNDGILAIARYKSYLLKLLSKKEVLIEFYNHKKLLKSEAIYDGFEDAENLVEFMKNTMINYCEMEFEEEEEQIIIGEAKDLEELEAAMKIVGF